MKPIAIECLTAFVGVELYKVESEYVTAAITNEKPRKYKIYYNANGDPYFKYHSRRHYLNNFIKV